MMWSMVCGIPCAVFSEGRWEGFHGENQARMQKPSWDTSPVLQEEGGETRCQERSCPLVLLKLLVSSRQHQHSKVCVARPGGQELTLQSLPLSVGKICADRWSRRAALSIISMGQEGGGKFPGTFKENRPGLAIILAHPFVKRLGYTHFLSQATAV